MEQNSIEYSHEMNFHEFIIIKCWKEEIIIEDFIVVSGKWKQES